MQGLQRQVIRMSLLAALLPLGKAAMEDQTPTPFSFYPEDSSSSLPTQLKKAQGMGKAHLWMCLCGLTQSREDLTEEKDPP